MSQISRFTYAEFLNSCTSDPFVHHGRHFGRAVHALCNVKSLIVKGILRMGELSDEPDESFTYEYANPFPLVTFYLILEPCPLQGKMSIQSILCTSPNGSWHGGATLAGFR